LRLKPGIISISLLVAAASLLVAALVTAVTDGLTASLVYSLPGGCIAYASELAAKEYQRRCALVTQMLEARLAAQKERTPREGRL